jgi:hypothetical protein
VYVFHFSVKYFGLGFEIWCVNLVKLCMNFFQSTKGGTMKHLISRGGISEESETDLQALIQVYISRDRKKKVESV